MDDEIYSALSRLTGQFYSNPTIGKLRSKYTFSCSMISSKRTIDIGYDKRHIVFNISLTKPNNCFRTVI